MAAPCGVLPAGLAACTTEFEDDLDGSALGGALLAGPAASNTEFEDDVDGGPAGGAIGLSDSVHH
jgi:hypothetical protein